VAALKSVTLDARHRARRWDAIVIGSGIPALVAAARLGQHEQRVLVVGEARASALPACVREPFFLAGARDGGILEVAMRELHVPLIDRRRIAPEPLAYQVVGDELRVDVGELATTVDELVAWGLAKPGPARSTLEALHEAAQRERDALLAAPFVRVGRRLGLGRSGGGGGAGRGLPRSVGEASAGLGRVFAAQVRALASHAAGGPSSEACARILGGALVGGSAVETGGSGLRELLHRRVEALYGEFRSLAGRFDLVNASGLPGMVLEDTREVWLAKALVVAAAPSALRGALVSERAGGLVGGSRAGAVRRLPLLWRVERRVLPEGMAPRVVLLGDDPADPQAGVATLAVHRACEDAPTVDVVGRVVLGPGRTAAQWADDVERRLRALMPFCEDGLERISLELPTWDDDDWLEEFPAGSAWPGEGDARVSSRPPVYRLDRAAAAGLGLEGEVLLGWRTGDAVAADLG